MPYLFKIETVGQLRAVLDTYHDDTPIHRARNGFMDKGITISPRKLAESKSEAGTFVDTDPRHPIWSRVRDDFGPAFTAICVL